MKKQTKILLATGGCIAALVLIASCSERRADVAYVQPQAPVVAAAPAVVAAPPVIVQAAPPAHDGFLTGMLMGHLMSGGGGTRVEHHYSAAPAPVVQNVTKNITVNKTVNTASTTTSVAKPAPSYSAPAYSSTTSRAANSGFTSRPSTSYSGSYSSRSSYSSYSSRSSFGGRR